MLLFQVRILRLTSPNTGRWDVVGTKGRLLNEKQAWKVRAHLIRHGHDADVFSMGETA